MVYLDQLRAQIDDNKTVADNVSDGNSHVTVDGKKKHVISYLEDFLFEPDRARTPARVLSGGERNRLLLARLFTKPANVLVLDEPTNDLDAETLDLLENLLVEFSGTLLLVSHDRAFLDEVVTSTLVTEGDGRWEEYLGGYSDYAVERTKRLAGPVSASAEGGRGGAEAKGSKGPAAAKPRRLTNKERAELAGCRRVSKNWRQSRRRWRSSWPIRRFTRGGRRRRRRGGRSWRGSSGTRRRRWRGGKNSRRWRRPGAGADAGIGTG